MLTLVLDSPSIPPSSSSLLCLGQCGPGDEDIQRECSEGHRPALVCYPPDSRKGLVRHAGGDAGQLVPAITRTTGQRTCTADFGILLMLFIHCYRANVFIHGVNYGMEWDNYGLHKVTL